MSRGKRDFVKSLSSFFLTRFYRVRLYIRMHDDVILAHTLAGVATRRALTWRRFRRFVTFSGKSCAPRRRTLAKVPALDG